MLISYGLYRHIIIGGLLLARNAQKDAGLLVEYTFELCLVAIELATMMLELRVLNGLDTVLKRILLLRLKVKKTGVEKKEQESTSIGLVAYEKSTRLPDQLYRHTKQVKKMVIDLGGKAKPIYTEFKFEDRTYVEIRLLVWGFDEIRKAELVRKYSVLRRKYRKLSR